MSDTNANENAITLNDALNLPATQDVLSDELDSNFQWLPRLITYYSITPAKVDGATDGDLVLKLGSDNNIILASVDEKIPILLIDGHPRAMVVSDGIPAENYYSEKLDEYRLIVAKYNEAKRANDSEGKMTYQYGWEFLLWINHEQYQGPATYHWRSSSSWYGRDKVRPFFMAGSQATPCWTYIYTKRNLRSKFKTPFCNIAEVKLYPGFDIRDSSTWKEDMNLDESSIAEALKIFRNIKNGPVGSSEDGESVSTDEVVE
jgi:hypothetical protein